MKKRIYGLVFVVFIGFLSGVGAYTKTTEADEVNGSSPALSSTVPDDSKAKKPSSFPTTSQSSSKIIESERSPQTSIPASISQNSETKKATNEVSTSEKSTTSIVESTTAQTPQERIDTSWSNGNWLMSIAGKYASSYGSDDVFLSNQKKTWSFEYLGLDIDAYRINSGDESLRIFWNKLKRVHGTNRNSKEAYWKFEKVSGGVKITNVAYPSKCLSVTQEGYGGMITFSNWKSLSSQIWTFSQSDYNYSQKVFYVPVNTTEVIDSGSVEGDIIWYCNGSKVAEGEKLYITPTSDNLSVRKFTAKRGDEEVRSVYVIPVRYNFVNQSDFSQYIDINSPVKSWVLPEDLTIPETVSRYNESNETFGNYRISSINESAFKGLAIKKITFGEHLDYICDSAFASSALEEIKNISSGTWLSNNAFVGTHIRSVVTDDPEKFARNTSEKVFNNYRNQKLTVWKKGGKQTFTTSYGSEVLTSYNLQEKANLSLSLKVSYPEGTQLRYPLDDTTTSFKDAKDCWQSYHTFQWYKDGARLVNQTSPMLELSSLKAADSGTYYATVDGQRVEEGKNINIKVKAENTTPSSPEPVNPDSWINVSVPISLEFHSSSDDYAKIESNPEKVVNHSGRAVKILVSHLNNRSDLEGIESLKLRASKGNSIDLKSFEEGKEVELVTLGSVANSTKNSSVSIEGVVDSREKQVAKKYKMNLVLKFQPLKQNGQPYS